jgi:hypothetical protein
LVDIRKIDMEDLDISKLKDTVQDCNINFLLGSGVSMPYLSTLGKIESFLTELAKKKEQGEVTVDQEKIIRVSLYKKFFDGAILKNLEILKGDVGANSVLVNYKILLKTLNSVLLNRKSTILNKQVNLFTTNVDVFLEKSLENTNVEYNDGFSGRFDPLFNLTNFKKSFFKTSLHYDNISELPVFNLMKIHGSLTWNKKEDENIALSLDLGLVEKIKSRTISEGKLIEIDDGKTIDDLVSAASGITPDDTTEGFIAEYEKLAIVNPTKEKFRETVLNRNYYELLRIYANELEKENTILFVAGFSFADEHIRDVTIRAANSNPTLKIYIFSHSSDIDEGVQKVKDASINGNVEIVAPSQKENETGEMMDEFNYNLEALNNRIFSALLKKIGGKGDL